MAVGIGRTAALLTVAVAVVLVAATQVPTAACRAVVVVVAPSAGEVEVQCVRRCTTAMLACAAASGCASATVWRGRRGGSGALAPCGGGGCESEYLGCIDVC